MLGEETLFSSLWLQNALVFALVWGLGSILTGANFYFINNKCVYFDYYCRERPEHVRHLF